MGYDAVHPAQPFAAYDHATDLQLAHAVIALAVVAIALVYIVGPAETLYLLQYTTGMSFGSMSDSSRVGSALSMLGNNWPASASASASASSPNARHQASHLAEQGGHRRPTAPQLDIQKVLRNASGAVWFVRRVSTPLLTSYPRTTQQDHFITQACSTRPATCAFSTQRCRSVQSHCRATMTPDGPSNHSSHLCSPSLHSLRWWTSYETFLSRLRYHRLPSQTTCSPLWTRSTRRQRLDPRHYDPSRSRLLSQTRRKTDAGYSTAASNKTRTNCVL